ncbi:hypothetical protein CAEBREN_08740 [Caenorhabditis brenneri]|uniref:Uncharacterized protein n=1 Tax=Caenorhabditis brenneri TaxID=135651 RepID=G0PD91_CAEBE|nr:hypothetical protein CAEBREN_08740 [Caenorhabditis brenneri]
MGAFLDAEEVNRLLDELLGPDDDEHLFPNVVRVVPVDFVVNVPIERILIGAPPDELFPPRHKAFRLPEHIRARTCVFQAAFIEGYVDWTRVKLQKGWERAFPDRQTLQRKIAEAMEFGDEHARRWENLEEVDEEELRFYVWKHQNGGRTMGNYGERQPRQLKEDVMKWAKKFITNQDYLDLIECQQHDGSALFRFLSSESQWKDKKWPFGLFVTVKSHMNRVMNSTNGVSYEFNHYY